MQHDYLEGWAWFIGVEPVSKLA